MPSFGAAAVEVAQYVLAATQGAVLPLVPYLDTLRWEFIVVALGGIADDLRSARRLAARAAMIGGLFTGIATSPWIRAALRYGAVALAVFLLLLRRSGERAGRLSERLEITGNANDVQRRMLETAARRPCFPPLSAGSGRTCSPADWRKVSLPNDCRAMEHGQKRAWWASVLLRRTLAFLPAGQSRAASSIKKPPAEVIGETIFKVYNVVFNGHDLTVSGAAVRRSSEAPANHLHVEYGAEDRS